MSPRHSLVWNICIFTQRGVCSNHKYSDVQSSNTSRKKDTKETNNSPMAYILKENFKGHTFEGSKCSVYWYPFSASEMDLWVKSLEMRMSAVLPIFQIEQKQTCFGENNGLWYFSPELDGLHLPSTRVQPQALAASGKPFDCTIQSSRICSLSTGRTPKGTQGKSWATRSVSSTKVQESYTLPGPRVLEKDPDVAPEGILPST